MATSYEILNLINREKNVGTCKNPWKSYKTWLADFKDFSNNTNPIESLNRVLKALCPTGKIKYITAVKIIQGWISQKIPHRDVAWGYGTYKQNFFDLKSKRVLELREFFLRKFTLQTQSKNDKNNHDRGGKSMFNKDSFLFAKTTL